MNEIVPDDVIYRQASEDQAVRQVFNSSFRPLVIRQVLVSP